MTDITKCKGTNCPFKELCYRFTAAEGEHYQSWFVDVPYRDDHNRCKYFQNNER